ncbi:MAG: STAS domain-containing protein [Candidatus Omnitrophica bacterium]|nr:STAS domain-containing protein [Candidatus Omnitrophota bacterium]
MKLSKKGFKRRGSRVTRFVGNNIRSTGHGIKKGGEKAVQFVDSKIQSTKRRFKKSGERASRVMGSIKKHAKMPNLADIFRDREGELLPCVKEIKRIDNIAIMRLQGTIDSSTIPHLSANISDDMKRYLDRDIILDFKDVSYVDTATLGYIIFLLDKLQKQRRKLGIINTTPLLENHFEIEKISALVRVYKSEEEALKELTQEEIS